MTIRQSVRKVFLVLTLLVVALGTGLGGAFAGVGLYFLITGGPDRVRQEFSGEIAAARRVSGATPPSAPIIIFIVCLGAGFALGMSLWKTGMRRTRRFDERELESVLRM
jgi:hypothetical protein